MQATLLFAHGSRDPAWRIPMENVARCMVKLDPNALVRCAYLELTEPDLPTAVAELSALGVDNFTVVPMFLGVGKHAREDMPSLIRQLRTDYPEAVFHLKPSVGEEAEVIELLARLSLPSR